MAIHRRLHSEPCLLHRVHFLIRLKEDFLHLVQVAKFGNSKRERNGKGKLILIRHGALCSLYGYASFRSPRFWENHHKFVSTISGNQHIFTKVFLKYSGNKGKYPVSCQVSIGIINHFQVIHVQKHKGESQTQGRQTLSVFPNPLIEEVTVKNSS